MSGPDERRAASNDADSVAVSVRIGGAKSRKVHESPHPEFETMLFLLTNRTRAHLSATQYSELAVLAKAFYQSIPSDVQILGEWAAADQSHNYSLLEAPDIDTVHRLQAPFDGFTESVIVPVIAIKGWRAN